ncbi:uncharacterized protein LOC106869020 [Octopus bimaculoides]|uniref:Uncharacterized protein n=1 Tax=Octopus bimaculoides TaxID=37653 RepID=A0A0L8HT56_OCTBM|nr:uncharacterized protein LOC106869020 [Octopus bimaculoides]|eukprot:XP_014769999.1 PREDICTED: uncharacterized protein LOC106869020 [Octopus bimaculoides]
MSFPFKNQAMATVEQHKLAPSSATSSSSGTMSCSVSESALHEWTTWRIKLNESFSNDIKIYFESSATNSFPDHLPGPLTGRLDTEPFKNRTKIPNFGLNLRQTYGRRTANQLQSHMMSDDSYLIYGLPRVKVSKEHA